MRTSDEAIIKKGTKVLMRVAAPGVADRYEETEEFTLERDMGVADLDYYIYEWAVEETGLEYDYKVMKE